MKNYKTFRAGNLEVMKFDLSDKSLSWKETKDLIAPFKSDRWGLPTIYELKYLYETFRDQDFPRLFDIGNFTSLGYWSSNWEKVGQRWCFDFFNGVKFLDKEGEGSGSFNKVRLVRDI